MNWDRGYYSQSSYTSGAYRELAPNWIDFAALVKGHSPPRQQEGSSFSYLELGSGMGFGLCLLAANYPEGSFVGVDFHPEHISHSLWLAKLLGLNNIHFLEADFVALQQDSSPLGLSPGQNGRFHYVVAHGIATWIGESVQRALLELAASALVPGGLFYCSYNTYPGWLARSAFQKLYSLESDRNDPSQPHQTIQKAVASLQNLIGSEESPQPLGHAFPSLFSELAWIAQDNPDYLLGEYGSEGWAPLYVADMHRRCREVKLSYLSSATLPELFDELLAPSLQAAVLEEKNPLLRQTLIDLATNKAFRRDLFVKGVLSLTQRQAERRLADLRVTGLDGLAQDFDPGHPNKQKDFEFTTTFGQVVGDVKVYGSVESALRGTSLSLGELVNNSESNPAALVLIVAMLLHAGRIGLDRGAAGEVALSEGQRVNTVLDELFDQGKSYGSRLLPRVGSIASISPVESLILKAHLDGLEGPMLGTCVLVGLEQLGVQLLNADKTVIEDAEARLKKIETTATLFIQRRLPVLKRLGALAAPPVPQGSKARRSAPK